MSLITFRGQQVSIPQDACGLVWSDPALRFHQKYLYLCSEDERRSYGVGTTWGWVNIVILSIFIFGWTNVNPLTNYVIFLLLDQHLKTFEFLKYKEQQTCQKFHFIFLGEGKFSHQHVIAVLHINVIKSR